MKNIVFMIRAAKLAGIDEPTMHFSGAGVLSRIFCLYASFRFTTISFYGLIKADWGVNNNQVNQVLQAFYVLIDLRRPALNLFLIEYLRNKILSKD